MSQNPQQTNPMDFFAPKSFTVATYETNCGMLNIVVGETPGKWSEPDYPKMNEQAQFFAENGIPHLYPKCTEVATVFRWSDEQIRLIAGFEDQIRMAQQMMQQNPQFMQAAQQPPR